jgi:hypothetical protein
MNSLALAGPERPPQGARGWSKLLQKMYCGEDLLFPTSKTEKCHLFATSAGLLPIFARFYATGPEAHHARCKSHTFRCLSDIIRLFLVLSD